MIQAGAFARHTLPIFSMGLSWKVVLGEAGQSRAFLGKPSVRALEHIGKGFELQPRVHDEQIVYLLIHSFNRNPPQHRRPINRRPSSEARRAHCRFLGHILRNTSKSQEVQRDIFSTKASGSLEPTLDTFDVLARSRPSPFPTASLEKAPRGEG
ncbi:hypothetical protein BKA70DRAFT_753110 [Coprinopsis sp. MPI-PUGE-AT-0042]|nr:hypothetical protein BKA70DRAFT_753110 [Coprinopsis sp. MPI-PUGE-AT-0042]